LCVQQQADGDSHVCGAMHSSAMFLSSLAAAAAMVAAALPASSPAALPPLPEPIPPLPSPEPPHVVRGPSMQALALCSLGTGSLLTLIVSLGQRTT
jgi:hypothetical protein